MCHPSGEVCFERALVDIAGVDFFAGNFDQDARLQKDLLDLRNDAVDLLFPERVSIRLFEVSGHQSFDVRNTYIIIHVSRPNQERTCIVRPLDVVELGAIQRIITSIEEVVLAVSKPYGTDPLVHLGGPVGIRLVASVYC